MSELSFGGTSTLVASAVAWEFNQQKLNHQDNSTPALVPPPAATSAAKQNILKSSLSQESAHKTSLSNSREVFSRLIIMFQLVTSLYLVNYHCHVMYNHVLFSRFSKSTLASVPYFVPSTIPT